MTESRIIGEQTTLQEFEDIEKLKKRLEELKKKKEKIKKFLEESECPSCDFAVAAGYVVSCYDDQKKAEEMKKAYIEGKITFEELFRGMNPDKDENAKLIYEYVKEKFDGIMDTYFTDWVE